VDTNHKTFTVIYSEGFFDDLENIPVKNALSILDGIDRLECCIRKVNSIFTKAQE